MKRLTSTIAAAATVIASTAMPMPAVAQDFYGLYLVGVQVVEMRTNADDPYIVAYVVEENGNISAPVFVPGENRPWENVGVGDVFRLDQQVWRGPGQDVMLQAHVYQYETGLRDFVAGFTNVTSAIAGALVAVGTGGTGAVAGVGIAAAGQLAAEKVRESAGDSIPMGEVQMRLELERSGALADAPQFQHNGIWYDFYTEHEWNGGFYGLLWEVRRM